MKKLLILVVSLITSGLVFAHGSARGPWSGNNTEYWQQMDRWHDVMHGISVDSENLEQGVQLNVTVDSDEILSSLKKDLQIHEKRLSEFFKGVEVTVAENKKGFKINLTSDNDRTVSRLQNGKNGLFYEFVQDQMHGRFGERMGYGGHMRGFGGNMRGCDGEGRGYGPGMMRGNYHNQTGDRDANMMDAGNPMM